MKEMLDSYGVIKHQSGIFELIFNTKEDWCDYHRYNDEMYEINDVNIEIERFLPHGKYVKTSLQDGNQIIFYFIPYELVKINNHEILNFKRFE